MTKEPQSILLLNCVRRDRNPHVFVIMKISCRDSSNAPTAKVGRPPSAHSRPAPGSKDRSARLGALFRLIRFGYTENSRVIIGVLFKNAVNRSGFNHISQRNI